MTPQWAEIFFYGAVLVVYASFYELFIQFLPCSRESTTLLQPLAANNLYSALSTVAEAAP